MSLYPISSYNIGTGIDSSQLPTLATVATTGNYSDLINKPIGTYIRQVWSPPASQIVNSVNPTGLPITVASLLDANFIKFNMYLNSPSLNYKYARWVIPVVIMPGDINLTFAFSTTNVTSVNIQVVCELYAISSSGTTSTLGAITASNYIQLISGQNYNTITIPLYNGILTSSQISGYHYNLVISDRIVSVASSTQYAIYDPNVYITGTVIQGTLTGSVLATIPSTPITGFS